jgi:hypothetical protein
MNTLVNYYAIHPISVYGLSRFAADILAWKKTDSLIAAILLPHGAQIYHVPSYRLRAPIR